MPRPITILILLTFSLISSFPSYANNSIESLVKFLASDSLEGRKPGKDGNILATNYLVTQLEKAGVDKLAGSYLQDFTIFTEMVKNGENSLKVNDEAVVDFQPISYSLSGEVLSSELVFAGFGISIPKNDKELSYDDYEKLNVEGKIVVVFTGDPGIGNLSSKFRDPDYINYRSIFYKLKNAITHGARGILLVSDPMSLSSYPQEAPPVFLSSEGGGNRFSILSGRTTNSTLNSVLKKLGKNSLSIQKKISQSQKPYSFELKTTASLNVHLKKTTGRVSNINGVIVGSDPSLKREVIVIGAHMDHLGFGGDSSMDASQEPKIHNGADDNASGTAIVIDLARKLKKLDLKRTIVFSLFNAEEMGLLGSSHFVDMWQRHEQKYGKIISMLNFDMVGRYVKDMSVMGIDSSLEVKSVLGELNSKINMTLKAHAVGSSDHASFINKKIPSLFFTTGAHEDYHTSSDTSEKINFTAMHHLSDYALGLVKKIDTLSSINFNPNYSSGEDSGRSRGYGAHLGCVPEFGQSDDIIGVQCVRSSDGSPAQKAGIKAGDIIVQIGDIEIKSIYDLAFALKYYRAGDLIELTWKRGATLLKQVVTLAKSSRH